MGISVFYSSSAYSIGRIDSFKNKYHYLRHAANNESHAFIDLTELDYNTVTLRGPAIGEATNYAFLTKIPTEDSEKISYATGYSDMIWYGMGNGDLTVTIPEDATCLAILYDYSNGTITDLSEKTVKVEIAEGVEITMVRSAVSNFQDPSHTQG